jgi:hypothetical protein
MRVKVEINNKLITLYTRNQSYSGEAAERTYHGKPATAFNRQPQGQLKCSVWSQAISDYVYRVSALRNLKLHLPQQFHFIPQKHQYFDTTEEELFEIEFYIL